MKGVFATSKNLSAPVRRLVGPAEPELELVVQLVKVPEVEPAVLAPLPDPQRARLALDELGIVEKGVDELKDKDDGSQQQVDQRHQGDLGLQLLGQLLPLATLFELLLQVPLVERGPGALEKEELQVVLKPVAEEELFADERDIQPALRKRIRSVILEHSHFPKQTSPPDRQQVLVDHGHQVVLEPEYPVVDVELGEPTLVHAHPVLLLRPHQLALHVVPGGGLQRRVLDPQGHIVERLDVPVLEEVVKGGQRAGAPEDERHQEADPRGGDRAPFSPNEIILYFKKEEKKKLSLTTSSWRIPPPPL